MVRIHAARAASLAASLFLLFSVGACSLELEDASSEPVPGTDVRGDAPVGASCQAQQDCASGVCVSGTCRQDCEDDAQCDSPETCDTALGFCRAAAGCTPASGCSAGETCDAGVCVALPDGACEPASVRCVGDAVVVCSPAGEIARTTECAPTGLCVVEEGLARCADVLCSPGDVRCRGASMRVTCSADGQSETEAACEGGTVCIEGACEATTCPPNQLRCSGDDLVACDFRGQEERLIETCDEGCQNNECVLSAGNACREGLRISCYGGTEPPSQLGACNYGEQVCTDGEFGACEGWTAPADLSCEPEVVCDDVTRRTAVVTRDAGARLVTWLRARGWTVEVVNTLEDSHLQSAELVMGSALNTSLSAPLLRTFVDQGGAFFLYGTGAPSADCALLNPSLGQIGVRFSCSTRVTGGATQTASHPAVQGLDASEIPFSAATAVEESQAGAGTPLASSGDNRLGLAVEIGCGRGVLWADGELLRDGAWDVAEPVWSLLIAWLSS